MCHYTITILNTVRIPFDAKELQPEQLIQKTYVITITLTRLEETETTYTQK